VASSSAGAGAVYRERSGAAAAEERRAAALSLRISWARLGAFLVLVVGGGFGVAGLGSGRLLPWIFAGAGLVALAGFISWHERVIGREGAFAARRIVNQQALARLERRFDALPVRSFPESATASPTARDLNLFGAGYLRQAERMVDRLLAEIRR